MDILKFEDRGELDILLLLTLDYVPGECFFSNSNFELVFVSRIPQSRLKKSVTEILLRRSVTETPTHFNPYRFRPTLSTTHRRLIPCKVYLNTHQT